MACVTCTHVHTHMYTHTCTHTHKHTHTHTHTCSSVLVHSYQPCRCAALQLLAIPTPPVSRVTHTHTHSYTHTHVSHVTSKLLIPFVAFHDLVFTRPLSSTNVRRMHVTCHTSHVTRHTSHVTCHTSHVTRHTCQPRIAHPAA